MKLLPIKFGDEAKKLVKDLASGKAKVCFVCRTTKFICLHITTSNGDKND